MRTLLLLLLFSCTCSFAQQASFYANAFRYAHRPDSTSEEFKQIMEMKWIINGQELRWYSDTIYVNIDDKIDTVFFQAHADADFDTLICSIREATDYEFFYNECCGAFNVKWSGQPRWGSIQFEVDERGKKKYIGQIDATGIIIQKDSVNLISPYCISAMAPNIFYVGLHEIVDCKSDDSDCIDSIYVACLQEHDSGIPTEEWNFKAKETLVHFYYMPLSSTPVLLRYNVKTGIFTLQ